MKHIRWHTHHASSVQCQRQWMHMRCLAKYLLEIFSLWFVWCLDCTMESMLWFICICYHSYMYIYVYKFSYVNLCISAFWCVWCLYCTMESMLLFICEIAVSHTFATHIRMWHGSFMYDMTHLYLTRRVMSINGSCLTHTHSLTLSRSFSLSFSLFLSFFLSLHIYESCHIQMRHVTHEGVLPRMNESCHTQMSHVT